MQAGDLAQASYSGRHAERYSYKVGIATVGNSDATGAPPAAPVAASASVIAVLSCSPCIRSRALQLRRWGHAGAPKPWWHEGMICARVRTTPPRRERSVLATRVARSYLRPAAGGARRTLLLSQED